ncbi:MAG: hypothetical protein QM621_03120 [Aeromicrobium sp.]|uniref:hypothetical protein n=1 Tax=Aeromicrobium sp. TaxID=1871063 RepID=UPI0039E2FB2A
MKDEQAGPPKKVVRKVAKKAGETAPGVRTVINPHTGRAVTINRPSRKPSPSTTVKSAKPAKPAKAKAAAPAAKKEGESTAVGVPESQSQAPVVVRRTARDVFDDWRLAANVRDGQAWRLVRRGSAAAGRGSVTLARRVAALRLPMWPDIRSVVATSIMVGLLVVALGAGVLAAFSQIFGVRSGGAWGVLAFTLLAVLGAIAGRVLLRWFGYPSPGVVAGLGALLTVLLLLVFLPSAAEGRWALLIVPALSLAAHLGAHAVAWAAEEDAESSLSAP